MDTSTRPLLPRPRALLTWSGLLVSALFTYLAVRGVDFRQVWDGLRSSNYWWLAPALALLAVGTVMRAVRWAFLFESKTRPPIAAVLSATLLGQFFNNVLPARVGEVARVVVLSQAAGTSRAEALGTVVLDRTYDVLTLLGLLFVTLPWLPHVTWLHSAAVLAIVLIACLGATFVIVTRHGAAPVQFMLRPLERLPFVSPDRIELAAVNLVQGLAALRRWRLALVATALSVGSWLIFGLSGWLVMRGFGFGLSPLAGLLVVIAIGLAMIIPSSPAAVGVFEAAVLVALHAYGIPQSQALSYALVLHALNFFPFIAVGLVVLHTHTSRVRSRTEKVRGTYG